MGLTSPKSQDHFEKHMRVLRLQFQSSLRKKEAELEEVICDIAAYGADRERLARLYYIAHGLVGVAPTYQFIALAQAAQKVEALVDPADLSPFADAVPAAPVLLAADVMADEVRKALGGGADQ